MVAEDIRSLERIFEENPGLADIPAGFSLCDEHVRLLKLHARVALAKTFPQIEAEVSCGVSVAMYRDAVEQFTVGTLLLVVDRRTLHALLAVNPEESAFTDEEVAVFKREAASALDKEDQVVRDFSPNESSSWLRAAAIYFATVTLKLCEDRNTWSGLGHPLQVAVQ